MIYKIKYKLVSSYLSTTGLNNWWFMPVEKIVTPTNGKIYTNKKAAIKTLDNLNRRFNNSFSLEEISI